VAEVVKRGVEALREIGKTVGNILVQVLSFGATLLTNTAKALIELGHTAVDILTDGDHPPPVDFSPGLCSR
jgi:hypothetical protein